MRSLSLLLFTICCFNIFAVAQNAITGLIYRISAMECQELLLAENPAIEFLKERQLTDTLFADSKLQDLPKGHYIIVRARGESIYWEIFSRNEHQIYLHDDQKQLNLGVVDAAGREVDNALVEIDQRRLKYDERLKHYQSRSLKGGLLQVYLPTDTLFYEIDARFDKAIVWRRIGYFSGSGVGKVVFTPWRWGYRAYHYLKRGIGRGRWRIHRWPFEGLYHKLINRDNQRFSGYLASQQPIYRHGDTLQLSAALSKENGKPIRKPLQLKIRANRKTFLDTLIAPVATGRYTYQWVLSDSLPLDTRYEVSIREPNWRSSRRMEYYFQLEDYELEEYEFELLDKQTSFAPKERVSFAVRAEDTNELPIPTASVECYFLADRVVQAYQQKIYLQDTLWAFREEMGGRTRLNISVPDSIWPSAKTAVDMYLYFRGPAGELLTDGHTFTVNRPDFVAELLLQQNQIKSIISSINANLPEGNGMLEIYDENKLLNRQSFAAGDSILLNPFATKYRWKYADQTAVLSLRTLAADIDFGYEWANDTLSLTWQNPHELPISWSMQTTGGKLRDGSSSNAFYRVQLPMSQSKRQLQFNYSYPWAGIVHDESTSIQSVNAQLQLSLQVPDRIYPGQQETIQLKVSDKKGRPVPAVAITGGAYNAQMRKGSPFSLSDIRFRGRRRAFHRQSYEEELATHTAAVYLDQYWYDQLGLDSLLYYQLRFPPKAGFFHYQPLKSADTTAMTTAQLSPWLIRDHEALPIHFIYIDNHLVYFEGAWQDTPYSIVAEPGYHKVAMRVSGAEIRVDSVLLKAGQQLIFSLNTRDFDERTVEIVPLPDHMTDREIAYVESRSFYLGSKSVANGIQYFYGPNKQVFRLNQLAKRITPIGLFNPNQTIFRLLAGIDTVAFNFEPYYYYNLSKDRDRLYAHRPFSTAKNPPKLDRNLPLPSLGEEAIFQEDIVLPLRRQYYDYDKVPRYTAAGRGRLQLISYRRPKGVKALLIGRADSVLYFLPVEPNMMGLPAGDYQLSWMTESDSIWQTTIQIRAGQLLSLKLDSTSMTKGLMPEDWHSVMEGRKRPYRTDTRQAPSGSKNYRGIGQLLSGRITDDGGEPLIGATILVQGTAIGTVTDLDGYYELWAPPGNVSIAVSYTGFETASFELRGQEELDITLYGGMALDEVVVSAYAVPRVQQDNMVTVATQIVSGKLMGVGITKNNPLQQLAIDAAFLPPPLDSIRSSFRDYAYWQPLLTTDDNGIVRFPVKFPDDITNWRHFAIASDRRARVGLHQAYTKAYLPLQAQLYTPRFLLEGDRSQVIGILNNRTDSPQQLESYFEIADGQAQVKNHKLEESIREDFDLPPVPENSDSIVVRYGLRQGDYRDGEERLIPVFPKGVERSVGGFEVLRNEESVSMDIAADKGPVTLLLGGNALPQIKAAINKLRTYPHACNEQTASRLLALLAARDLAETTKEKASVEAAIRAAIQRLDKARHADGTWGWWPSSEQSSIWISMHVLRVLKVAETKGFSIPDVTDAERGLLSSLPGASSETQWDLLHFFAERGQQLPYESYLRSLDTITRDLPTEMRYRRIQQLRQIPYVLDSLDKYRQQTLTGASYWGEPNRWYQTPYRHTTWLSLQAYQLYKHAGQTEKLASIQQFFLLPQPGSGVHNTYHLGVNTYEASLIVQGLVEDVLEDHRQDDKLKVFLMQNGEAASVVDILPAKQIHEPANAAEMSLRKTGPGPVFLSYAQTYWEPRPQAEDNGFQLSTRAWQGGTSTDSWTAGSAAELTCKVTLEADAHYVKIEIPVPGGCSYGPKIFKENRYEVHREYRRDRVIIYCQLLPAGDYTFRVPLEPRFSGNYHINPAQAEMMYVPSINGIGNSLEMDIK